VIIGGETGGRWLGGFDHSLRAVALSPFVSQTLTMLVSSESAADLEVVRGLVEAGDVVPAIDRTLPLDDVPAAIRYVHEGRAQGKVVISL
jgi:NADPH:quinone reductase-like Zn-dependent oxidoreductase